MEKDGQSSERDRKLKNSFESPKAGAEAEKKPEKKKPRLVLVEMPAEAQGPRKTEQAAGQPKPPEQLFTPKLTVEQQEKTEEPAWKRPELVVVPGLKETEPESTKDKAVSQTPEAKEASPVPEKTPAKPETPETESSEPEITEAEKPAVINEYVDAAKPALQEELKDLPEGSPEIPEVMANVVFLDKLREAANKGEPLDDAGMEDVFEQTAQVLELPLGETTDEDIEGELAEEQAEENIEPSEEPDAEAPEAAGQVLPAAAEAGPDANTDSLTLPTTPLPTAGVTPPVPTQPVSTTAPMGGLPGGSNIYWSSGGGGLHSSRLGGGGPPSGPNALGLGPNVLKPSSAERRKQRNKNIRRAALIAGVAYLVGRRHGRLKSERESVPVRQKLEREVKDLQQKVAIQEQRLRKLVAAKVEQSPASAHGIREVAKPFVARLDYRPPVQAAEQTPVNAEAPVLSSQERAEEAAEAPAYREREIVYAQRHPEKLGKFVVSTPENAAALAPLAAAENVARAYELPAAPAEVKSDNVEVLTVPQLIEVAAKITIGGVSAEQLFRSERLDAAGLRKVVTEYVRGGNPERVLDQQLKLVEAKRSQSMEYVRPGGSQPGDAGGVQASGGGAQSLGTPSVPAMPFLPVPTDTAPSRFDPLSPSPIDPQTHRRKAQHIAQITAVATVGGVVTILLLLLLL